MARWQKVYLNRQTAETTTSTQNTVTIDLPQKDFLSQILVRLYHLNTTYTAALVPVFHAVSKLEVIDGSDVIYSLSGAQAQAVAYYRGRTNPCPGRNDWESTETSDVFYIRFGRFIHDTKYLLNLGALTNPQLKITYDYATTSHDGYTYTCPTTPTVKYTVVCDILRGSPAGYVGEYISAREIFTYTSAASSTEYINIPRTDKIYGIGVRAVYTANLMGNDLSRVRLNINNQEWIPFDIYWAEMEQLHAEWFEPFITTSGRIEMYYQVRYDSGLGEIKYWNGIEKTTNLYTIYMEGLTGGWIRPHFVTTSDGAAATTGQSGVHFIATGLFPHHMIYLPMAGVTDTPEDTLDAPATSKILLEVTSNSSASGSCTPSVVLDVVRSQ